MKLKWFIFYIFLFVVVSVGAMSSKAGLNCIHQSVTFQNRLVILNTNNISGPHVYRFQNIADKLVQLNHSTGVGMQAGWASNIDPNHMTAILTNQKSFFFSCAYLNAQEVPQLVDCSKVIKVCEMKNIIYPSDPSMVQGQYWIVENRTANDFNNSLMQRGFELKV